MKRRYSKQYEYEWRGLPYVALEDQNFLWKMEEVEEFDRLWEDGADIKFLCKHFNRTQVGMAILILDRALKGEIKRRKYGLWGGSYKSGKLRK